MLTFSVWVTKSCQYCNVTILESEVTDEFKLYHECHRSILHIIHFALKSQLFQFKRWNIVILVQIIDL